MKTIILFFCFLSTLFAQIAVTPTTFVNCTQPLCLRVGFTFSSTGQFANEDNDLLEGYIIWAETANSNGIVNNGTTYGVELVGYDDEGNNTLVEIYYQQMIDQDNITFFLGPFSSNAIMVANDVIAANDGDLIIHGSGANENLYNNPTNVTFGVLTSNGRFSESLLDVFQNTPNLNRIFVASSGGSNGNICDGVSDFITANGLSNLEVVANVQFPNNSNAGFNEVLQMADEMNPDIFFSCNPSNRGQALVSLAYGMGFRPRGFFISSLPADDTFISNLGTDAEFIVGAFQWHPSASFTGSIGFLSTADYVTAFNARFPAETVNFRHAAATAAGIVLETALTMSPSVLEPDVAAVLPTLNINTFFGPVAFDSFGRNIAKQMAPVQVINGQIEIIGPANQATATFVYPIPGSTPGNIFPFTQCNSAVVTIFDFEVCIISDVVDCTFVTTTTLNGQEIITNRDRLDSFTAGSINETCQTAGPCQFCTRFTNLAVNSSFIDGCAQVDITCLGATTQPIELGCFEDGEVAAQCFGACPDSCNFNGICLDGVCDCAPMYFGETCEFLDENFCPNDCGGDLRGTCDLETGECNCLDGFSGEDCSGFENSDESNASNDTTIIVATVVSVVVACFILAALVGYFGYKHYKKRNEHSKITELSDVTSEE